MKYWAKYKKEGHSGSIHLLAYHSLDVAAVGHTIVQCNLFNIADYLKEFGLQGESAADFFGWLLSWHDLGKFAFSFQQLVHFEDQPKDWEKIVFQSYRHDTLGFCLWKQLVNLPDDLKQILPPSDLDVCKTLRVLEPWMAITTGHHGVPPNFDPYLTNFTSDNKQAALDFLKQSLKIFPHCLIPLSFGSRENKEKIKRFSWIISGVVVLCDWIGSNSRYFSWSSEPMPLEDYWQIALQEAEQAVQKIPTAPQPEKYQGVNFLFPFICRPSPLQQAVEKIEINDVKGPKLFILEDLTGSGKTEAALILANRLISAGEARGIFYGLPTMATANAMYSRLADVVPKLYEKGEVPSLILAHSRNKLMDTFTSSVFTDQFDKSDECNREIDNHAGCSAWFTDSKKKSLLADIGVGTVDQILMSVLQFRHNNLRLLGLRNKVVIVDELHAYDAYMAKVLEELIKVLAFLGSHIILLSATLSIQQRAGYIKAFKSAFPKDTKYGSNQLTPHYPWLTYISSNTEKSLPIASARSLRFEISWLYELSQCIRFIHETVRAGKCIVWIRNTIDDALSAYRELIHDPEINAEDVLLFHSRFAFVDRQRIENQALESLGKRSCSEQRSGKIIISTQVIEQSLDIDADEMISDLAPIDLLIQRSGRLHRHIRDREGKVVSTGEDTRSSPILHIFAPRWDENPSGDWYSSMFRGASYVYPNHGKLWLSQKILRENSVVKLPEQARELIESVYGCDVQYPEGLRASEEKELGKFFGDRAFAAQNLIRFGAGYRAGENVGMDDSTDLIASEGNYFSSDVSTRNSERSINLWLARIDDGEIVSYAGGVSPQDWEASRLTVREGWLKNNINHEDFVSDELLEQWCQKNKQRKQTSQILLISDSCVFYSPKEGLIGKNNK